MLGAVRNTYPAVLLTAACNVAAAVAGVYYGILLHGLVDIGGFPLVPYALCAVVICFTAVPLFHLWWFAPLERVLNALRKAETPLASDLVHAQRQALAYPVS